MAIFFVGWELWQDMTFVLACCIVLVFLVGVFRLWLSNRKLRKHEVIEEERRVRLAEMRHCGIEALRAANEIPFGVRALESGVEVEGIWISQSNTPDGCRTPASATPISQHRTAKGKERMAELRLSPYTEASVRVPPVHGPVPTAEPASDADDILIEQGRFHGEPYLEPYTPTGFHDDQRATYDACLPREWRSSALPLTNTQQRMGTALGRFSCDFPADAALYGAAAVYANRSTRRLSAGFEVLPAGVLGPRQEFGAHDGVGGGDVEGGNIAQHRQGQSSKLQERSELTTLEFEPRGSARM